MSVAAAKGARRRLTQKFPVPKDRKITLTFVRKGAVVKGAKKC
jgi:hypothetical protein